MARFYASMKLELADDYTGRDADLSRKPYHLMRACRQGQHLIAPLRRNEYTFGKGKLYIVSSRA
jgi:hypothetical protein